MYNSLASLYPPLLTVSLCSASRDLKPALGEVPVWPTFDFRFWGQMTSKVKIFENVLPDSSTGHRNTKFGENRLLWSCRKVAQIPYQKNSRSARLVPASILPKMGRSRPKFSERCHRTKLAALCRTYSGKVDFLAQKVNTIQHSQYNNRLQSRLQRHQCLKAQRSVDCGRWDDLKLHTLRYRKSCLLTL